jgi:hypothetical protein
MLDALPLTHPNLTLCPRIAQELFDKGCFPHAGFASHKHYLPLTPQRFLEPVLELFQLPLAADESWGAQVTLRLSFFLAISRAGFSLLNLGDEPVAPAYHGLNKPRRCRVVS